MSTTITRDLKVNMRAADGTLYRAGSGREIAYAHAVEFGYVEAAPPEPEKPTRRRTSGKKAGDQNPEGEGATGDTGESTKAGEGEGAGEGDETTGEGEGEGESE